MVKEKMIIPDDRLLNEEETAKILGLKPVTIRKRRYMAKKPNAPERCKMPYTLTPTKRVRYRFGDIVKYLEDRNTNCNGDMREILSEAYYAE